MEDQVHQKIYILYQASTRLCSGTTLFKASQLFIESTMKDGKSTGKRGQRVKRRWGI